jgi:nicotinamide-nucleotide amidase
MRFRAEVISTGDEVLTGAVVDSNAAYLAEQLTETGVVVKRHTVVGDCLEILTDLFRSSGNDADIVLVTGGLGPTQDDLTAPAAAEAAGVPLVLDAAAMDGIERYFRSRDRHMSEANRKQAMFPRGAETMENPVGTAPGFTMKIGKAMFFFMPGVPHEMRQMMTEQVTPRIQKLQGSEAKGKRMRVLYTFGLGESDAAQRLSGFDAEFSDLRLGFQVKFPGIYVKVYGGEGTQEKVSKRIDDGVEWICGQLGDRVVSAAGDSLEAVVGELLRKRAATLAVAESCTGGLISDLLTNVPGSSDYFLFSGVTYANEAKSGILGVPTETLETYGAVHEETVKEMAEGARKAAGATYGLATSGIAGPDGGTVEKPVGTVCIGLAGPEGVYARRRLFTFGGRLMKKQIFAAAALDVLRKHLMG